MWEVFWPGFESILKIALVWVAEGVKRTWEIGKCKRRGWLAKARFGDIELKLHPRMPIYLNWYTTGCRTNKSKGKIRQRRRRLLFIGSNRRVVSSFVVRGVAGLNAWTRQTTETTTERNKMTGSVKFLNFMFTFV